MSKHTQPINRIVHELRERAKELSCLYTIQELLSDQDRPLGEICQDIVEALPPGWQYPDACQAQITYSGNVYATLGFKETPWVQSADVIVQSEIVGQVIVCYTEERPPADEGPFLKEERKLITSIADQLGFYILHQQLHQVFQEQQKAGGEQRGEWSIILNLLKRTDPGLLMRITRKMLNYLDWKGIKDAEQLLDKFGSSYHKGSPSDPNRPYQQEAGDSILTASDDVFAIAARHISRDEILENTQKWIKEERSGFLVSTLVNPGSSISEISIAVERYHHLASQGIELTPSRDTWFRAAIIRRVLSDQPSFIKVAKQSLALSELSSFLRHIIYPVDSHGKLGGKGAGLLLADQVLKQSDRQKELFPKICIPKTWYISSDTVFYSMIYNNLEDIVEQRFKDINQIRQEYPSTVHFFKSSRLPPEITQGLSLALDDFGDVPLIVRSSSLLEDRAGLSFAGKYKSLFIANQGSKEERLAALTDAINEVYASLFSPDAIEYRIQHGLLDHREEMGIMIQEVVGKRVGHYYLPAFAGVAFTNNEFRWSKRIKQEDGLIRIVPGLGTRAVDRLTDDYPVLVSPGQPKLRVNASPDEIIRYSPQKIDVINLEARTFETVEIRSLLKECGSDYPLLNLILSSHEQGLIQPISALGADIAKGNFVVTFEGLFSHTPFLKQMRAILEILQEVLDYSIDIEFAHDGECFYLLQCRAQSHHEHAIPAQIPRDIAREKVIFSAKRYITNGQVLGITHIVYVDPQKYSELNDYQSLVGVGRAVGRLNQILPKRRFILMGPGRWGSRGDIKLGVDVTYSDINNTAMLIEIARRKADYVPEPSFGTHFFQDLVEAAINYLPIYPDDLGVIFNESFLRGTKNSLTEHLPEFADLADVIRLIDVPASANDQVLNILMNADQEEAIAFLAEHGEK